MATYKQIEQAREIRMWLGQVIVPAFAAGAMLLNNEKAREWIDKKFGKVKSKIVDGYVVKKEDE